MWWLAGVLVWTVLALMSVSQTALFVAHRGQEIPWTPHIRSSRPSSS